MWTIYKKEAGYSGYIPQNEIDKSCFQHGRAYGDFKDLSERIASDKLLGVKAFNIAKNPKYDGYQRGFASVVCKFIDKKTSGGAVKSQIMSKQELLNELHKSIIRKFLLKTIFRVLIWHISN